MKELPFDPYDFFGYIASGLALAVLSQVTLGFPKVLGTDLKPFDIAVTILGVYILGQIVAGPSKFLLEDLLVNKLLGSPTRNLRVAHSPILGRFLFPGFYRPLPASVRMRLSVQLQAYGLHPHDHEGTFLSIRFSPEVCQDGNLLARMDKFRDMYGFNRNISFSLLFSASCLFFVGKARGDPMLIEGSITAAVSGVLLFYRFLKFYRQYSYELLNTYSQMKGSGSNDV